MPTLNILTRAGLSASLLVFALGAQAATNADLPAGAIQALNAGEKARDSAYTDRYPDAIGEFGNARFRSWYDERIAPRTSFQAGYTQTGTEAVSNTKDALEMGSEGLVLGFSTPGGEDARWGAHIARIDPSSNTAQARASGDLFQLSAYRDQPLGEWSVRTEFAYTDGDMNSAGSDIASGTLDIEAIDIRSQVYTSYRIEGWLVRSSLGVEYRHLKAKTADFTIDGDSQSLSTDSLDLRADIDVSRPLVAEALGNSLFVPYVGVGGVAEVIEASWASDNLGDTTEVSAERNSLALRAGAQWQMTPQTALNMDFTKGHSQQVSVFIKRRF